MGAYQAKRKVLYTADLELTEEDGTVVHTLHVELDPDSVVRNLSEKQVDLVRAINDISAVHDDTSTEQKLMILGRSVTDMFEAVFGKEGAQTIINFYGSRYIEMTTAILPFITQEVIQEIRKMSQESRKQVMQTYNRSQRRKLFGRK